VTNEDEKDTDPSTPTARRSGPPPRAHGTDPGVGPPGERPAPAGRPLGIVVPPPSVPPPAQASLEAGGARKDSVELLLEGMAGPRPDRTKTTRQTHGEAAAVYHTEHEVHRGWPSFDEEPKVLVERPPTPRAIPLAARARRVAALRSTNPPLGAQATVSTGRGLKRRIVTALVAGLLVVTGLFALLPLTLSAPAGDSAAPTLSTSVGEPQSTIRATTDRSGLAISAPASAMTVMEPSVTTAGTVPAAVVAERPSGGAPIAPPSAPAAVPVVRARRSSVQSVQKVVIPPAVSTNDVGEFKTSF
jgi:hypothetical protein